MPSASDLSDSQKSGPVRVLFASGTAELNALVLEHFLSIRSDLPLCVVSEFEMAAGEWIPWHVQRPFEQNLAGVKAALGGRLIAAAGVVYDSRSALGDLRRAAEELAPGVLHAYDEEMRHAAPGALRSLLLRRRLRAASRQLRRGGRVHAWLRRAVHPAEAEIPVRARLAQMKGIVAARARIPVARERRGDGRQRTAGVTIVIPSRDGRELLREMLPPLLKDAGDAGIIVVDNGSSDGTAQWLALEYPAIRVMESPDPLSFAQAVNLGICEARTQHTLLLNNDMIVEPGFVRALGAAFDRVPDLFCATAQIVFPPGVRREETGKAVWRRANEMDFPVRCDDPLPGEDLTWVLYGSGGCSLFDTEKLLAIGGVSEIYDPAYVEDLDFGYEAWKRGWPSVYCGNAVVEHRHRSTTSRFYSERQIDFFVERNYLRFVAKAVSDPALFRELWTGGIRRLQLQAAAGRGAALDALRDVPAIAKSPAAVAGVLAEPEILALTNGDVALFRGEGLERGMTVLIASPYLPYPLSHGGAVRMFNLLRGAAETVGLILVAFVDKLAPPPEALLRICREIVLVRRHGTHYRRDTARPDAVEEFDSATFRACLKQAVHQWKPCIAQLEFTWMAQYVEACHPAKTILVEHDITFDLQKQLLADPHLSDALRLELQGQLAKWTSFETAAWGSVDCVVTMSGRDTAAVTGAARVECLPNGVDCERFAPDHTEPEPRRLLLIGSFAHLPNLLALEFFLKEVWPRLEPGYTLHVIGGARHEYYLEYFRDRVALDLNQPNIEIQGFVEDVRSAYRRAAIVLAPLTASAGTNIKVLEAMAMGKAVVSTPAGVNGLDIAAGRDFLLARDAEEFARGVGTLTTDRERRIAIEQAARETALRYDWRGIAARQQDLYARLGAVHIQ
ncbi:MAG TPA: glycosyltransferase [Bryobacteraceae bacterium]|nr:glycosyltransferase [Bryobacteraceae bacterium]